MNPPKIFLLYCKVAGLVLPGNLALFTNFAIGKNQGPQSTHWCFTVHDYETVPEVMEQPKGVQYIVYQAERAASGAKHIQGYVQFEKRSYGTAVSKLCADLFGGKPSHNEPARGSDQDNESYCTKEETRELGPYRFGVRVPHAGKKGGRSDLLAAKKSLDEGKPSSYMWQEHFSVMTIRHKAFKEYKRVTTKPRDFKTTVVLLVGPSGTGKSRTATILGRLLGDVYKVPEKHGSGNMWCDDYQGEEVMWIDEMDGSRMTPTYFNQLADRYECVLPAHGGVGHQMVSKFLIICSNYHPKYWWKKRNPDQVKQTIRRIDLIIKMIPPQPVYRHEGWQMFGNNLQRNKK